MKMRWLVKVIAVTLMIVVCLSVENKYHSEQYSKMKTSCTSRCHPKGYFQDLCIKVCMSPSCYQEAYKSPQAKRELQLGAIDTEQKHFRKCWMDSFANSEKRQSA